MYDLNSYIREKGPYFCVYQIWYCRHHDMVTSRRYFWYMPSLWELGGRYNTFLFTFGNQNSFPKRQTAYSANRHCHTDTNAGKAWIKTHFHHFCEKENQLCPFDLQNENHNRNFALQLKNAKTHADGLIIETFSIYRYNNPTLFTIPIQRCSSAICKL